jgi:hypothetical protein
MNENYGVFGNIENYNRALRVNILRAFDVYKINVQYGIELENEQEHNDILLWYNRILDLNEESIINIPNKIKKYL